MNACLEVEVDEELNDKPKCWLELCIATNKAMNFCELSRASYENWFENATSSYYCCDREKRLASSNTNTRKRQSAVNFIVRNIPSNKQPPGISADTAQEENKKFEKRPESRKDIFSYNKSYAPTFEKRDSLSSNKAFIDSLALVVYIWFVAIISAIGNLVLIGCTFRSFKKSFNLMSKVERIHNTMLINLALSDLLMAAYMSAMGILSMIYQNKYKNETRFLWIQSEGCSILGILNFISCQVSVTTLVIMTSFRLYHILHPYKNVSVRWSVICVVAGWITWTTVACIPLIQTESTRSIFTSTVMLKNNSTQSNGKTLEKLETARYDDLLDEITTAINTINFACPNNLTFHENPSWSTLLFFSDRLTNNGKYVADVGYYNEQSLCTMRYFISATERSLFFTMLVLAFNALSFVYITFAYSHIHYKVIDKSVCYLICTFCKCFSAQNANGSNHAVGPVASREKENVRLHRLVVGVIVTDFLCWIPLTIVAFWYVAYTADLDYDAFWRFYLARKTDLAIFAIVVMPINSMINPVLHSARLRNVLKKFFAKVRGISKYDLEGLEMQPQIPSVEADFIENTVSCQVTSTAVWTVPGWRLKASVVFV